MDSIDLTIPLRSGFLLALATELQEWAAELDGAPVAADVPTPPSDQAERRAVVEAVPTPTARPYPEFPAATEEPPAPPAAGPGDPVEVDVNGMPWDGRIHTANKAKTQKGVWKARRGVDDAERSRVEAELRTAMAAHAPTEQAAPPPPPAQPQITPPAAPGSAFEQPTGGAEFEASPTPPAPPAAAPGASPATFAEFAAAFAGDARATDEMLAQACQAHGVPSFPSLSARPDLIPAVWATLQQAAGGVA